MGLLAATLLTDAELKRIASAITDVERGTVGELRVSVKQRASTAERNIPVRERALREFYALGMEKTAGKTGVLLFISAADRRFHILGDEGINAVVPPDFWDGIAGRMGGEFSRGRFADGIVDAVREIGDVLKTRFPKTASDTNELSDDVVIS